MTNKSDRTRFGQARYLSGLLVIAIGTIFLLNNLGILDARDVFHRSWFGPVAIIAAGVVMLFHRRNW